ncbi:MAG: ATP-binding protein [Saprospiraceae bacterium]|nr:ATP-binding protein [Saprospiraceae bacterium]
MEQDILKIVVTGPESSGKTVLAEALANYFRVPWVPEFARYYVAHLGRPYMQEDLITIYAGQHIWENWYLEQTRSVFTKPDSPTLPALVCDTDWTVLRIWEKYGYNTPSVLPQPGDWELAGNTLYLLCSPDFPWQPDPLREHPEERWQLFDLYKDLLRERQLPHLVLQGHHNERLLAAVSEISKLLRPLQ